jgi:hypothetical protein
VYIRRLGSCLGSKFPTKLRCKIFSVDLIIRWLLCWTYIAELFNKIFGDTRERRFRVAPKIIRNEDGYSDWFVYANNGDAGGNVDQNASQYILSDEGRPLLPVADSVSGSIAYYEVATHGDTITRNLKRRDGGFVPGHCNSYGLVSSVALKAVELFAVKNVMKLHHFGASP